MDYASMLLQRAFDNQHLGARRRGPRLVGNNSGMTIALAIPVSSSMVRRSKPLAERWRTITTMAAFIHDLFGSSANLIVLGMPRPLSDYRRWAISAAW